MGLIWPTGSSLPMTDLAVEVKAVPGHSMLKSRCRPSLPLANSDIQRVNFHLIY